MACYLAKDVDEIIYTHVANQHEDSLRFLHDCEKLLGRKIHILQSDKYDSVDDVIERTRCINTAYGAPCTKWLKKQVRRDWEQKHYEHHTYVWGFDVNEKARAKRLSETMSDYDHEFPLIDNYLSKEECHGIADKLGLKRPVMYDLGYRTITVSDASKAVWATGIRTELISRKSPPDGQNRNGWSDIAASKGYF